MISSKTMQALMGRRRVFCLSLMAVFAMSLNRLNSRLTGFYDSAVDLELGDIDVPEASRAVAVTPSNEKEQQKAKEPIVAAAHATPIQKPLLPNMLIIGAQKAGSTALSDWLFQKGVCGGKIVQGEPPFYKKEMHFFDNDDRYAMGKEFYKQRYAHCATKRIKLRLDATPTTMQHPDRVYQTYKNVRNIQKLKIIVSLREPISRELSLYNHQLSQYNSNPDPDEWYATVMHHHQHPNGTTKAKTFDEFVDTVTIPSLHNNVSSSALAHYAHYLQQWYDLFDPQQILVLSYQEDIRNNPSQAKRRLRQFLGYPFPTTGKFPETNTHAGQQKVKTISCAVRNKLHAIFEPWNQELYALLANQTQRIPGERPPVFPRFVLPKCVEEAAMSTV